MNERLNDYTKKIMKVSKNLHGSRSQTIVQKSVEFDFESIGLDDFSDTPRQKIIKKKNFPLDMLSIVTKAEFIDFKKDKVIDRKELVIDVYFVYDLQKKNFERENGGKNINYSGVSIRFHLPKRFQDKFEGCNPNQLVGSFFMSPSHDDAKWRNEKDHDKSSIPLIVFLKNSRSFESIGLLLEECPSIAEFQNEAELLKNEGYEANEIMKTIFDCFTTQAKYFFDRETHITNKL